MARDSGNGYPASEGTQSDGIGLAVVKETLHKWRGVSW